MRSELFSRAVPLLSGASLIAAGAIQFTRWKMMHLVALPLTIWMLHFMPPT
jgi:hypothetical protein